MDKFVFPKRTSRATSPSHMRIGKSQSASRMNARVQISRCERATGFREVETYLLPLSLLITTLLKANDLELAAIRAPKVRFLTDGCPFL